MRTPTSHHAVAVVVDGTPADAAVLTWAAEEADRDQRPLLLAHATGHLPPDMTYAERHVARSERVARGERLLEDAARYVHRLVPGLAVSTVVRLLRRDALLPAISQQASLLTGASPSWQAHAQQVRNPVVAAVDDAASDAHVVHFAADYAAHRGLDLKIIEHSRRDAPRKVLEGAHNTSLLLLPRPESHGRGRDHEWSTALEISRRSSSPVALVSAPPRYPG